MSTRAMIGYLSPEDSVTGIYSHWDGYPTGLGHNLMKFYGNPRRVLHLIDGGDVSAIDWDTGQANHYAFRVRSRWLMDFFQNIQDKHLSLLYLLLQSIHPCSL